MRIYSFVYHLYDEKFYRILNVATVQLTRDDAVPAGTNI